MNAVKFGSSNSNASSSGAVGWMTGRGVLPQLVLALVIATAIYIVLISLETIYKSFIQVNGTRVELMPYNCASEDKAIQFIQKACTSYDETGSIIPTPRSPFHKFLPMSDNERTGAEFSYSFYIWVNPATFREEEGLAHIFHKGYNNPFPLMAPGVFMKSNINTMRIYMNSSETWNNYVEVENFPVKKWVHVAIVARGNAIEIYINGNVAKKLTLQNSVFYQNFQDLYVFNQIPSNVSPTVVPSLKGENFRVFGAFKGNLSNLFYYSYALSFTEIDSLLREGPSSRSCLAVQAKDTPPYLEDDWWINNYGATNRY
jgi:hypothetical protein